MSTGPTWPPRGTHLELVVVKGKSRQVLVIDCKAEGELLPEHTEPASSSRIRTAPVAEATRSLPPIAGALRELVDGFLSRPIPASKRSA